MPKKTSEDPTEAATKAAKATRHQERLVKLMKIVYVQKCTVEQKYEAIRIELRESMASAGATCIVTSVGTIPLQTTVTTTVDWESLARKIITPDILTTALPDFTSTKTSKPWVAAPLEWRAALKAKAA